MGTKAGLTAAVLRREEQRLYKTESSKYSGKAAICTPPVVIAAVTVQIALEGQVIKADGTNLELPAFKARPDVAPCSLV